MHRIRDPLDWPTTPYVWVIYRPHGGAPSWCWATTATASPEALPLPDMIVEIPMVETGLSLNVAIAEQTALRLRRHPAGRERAGPASSAAGAG